MTKYVPIESEPIEATFWDSDEAECVLGAVKLLIEHGYAFTFQTHAESYDIEIEIREGKNLIHTVMDRTWLIFHGNTVESMSSTSFFKTYRAA